ncbi:hypothetical protein NQ317_014397 [Molorchus minor]|uniref:Amidophosphoribosyltransferase n=1 Tax=Molorchus minor TaxID=1323400 RepID=A0ABQ9K609_9CUCU|nr:hypothetical protein NQ317_014397 [Molorchus minor]
MAQGKICGYAHETEEEDLACANESIGFSKRKGRGRGQESAGIVTSEGRCSKSFNVVKGMGMISNIFNDDAIRRLKGSIGIGHTRYSTSAASEEVNCQPFVVHTAHGALAVAHNGELVNCDSLRKQVLDHGVGLSTHSDSELITQALCLNPPEALSGDCDDSREAEGWVYVREVFPGEIIEMTRHGIRTIDIVTRPANKLQAFCIFEYVYFARSDSIFEGQMVYAVRMQCGRQLAIEQPVEADIVSAVPESGNAAAHGFSRQSGISFAEVLCKNSEKFGALSGNVKGKRVILIDDSIVRGNTIGPIIKLLKNAGATEVHIRVASPPLLYPCYMGINIPTREELIANKLNTKELALHVGADSLSYLSIEGLIKAVRSDLKTKNSHRVGHCTACLSGIYPGGIPNKDYDMEW